MGEILWAPCFQAGSYFPAVPIVRELQRRGHRVTAVCEAASESTFRSLGCDFRPTSDLDRYLAGYGPRLADAEAKRRWIAGYVPNLFQDVAGALAERRYDALMADPLETGADFAAEMNGVAWFSYVHFAMDETGPDVPFCFHFWTHQRPAPEEFVDWWNGLRAGVGLPSEPRPAGQHRWYRHSPWLTLVLGLPELVEPRGQLPPYAVRVGPLVWEPPVNAPPPAWLEHLGVLRPAVLASVSTSRQADADLIVSVGKAAERHGLDVIATIGAEHHLPELTPNVRVTGFMPHDALVRRVAIVACHAGNGTVTRAACAGVPLLLFPTGRDQFQVARGARMAGLAIELDPDHRDVLSVTEAMGELLDGDRYGRRAREFAREAQNYDAAAVSADRVEALIRSGVAEGRSA